MIEPKFFFPFNIWPLISEDCVIFMKDSVND